MQDKVLFSLLFVYFMHFFPTFNYLFGHKSNKKQVFNKTPLHKSSFQNKR